MWTVTFSTFNNLKNQLHEIGLTSILDNIDDIAKQQTLKKEEQRRLREEQKSIEKEKKIQKDMEAALDKLKNERKWRAAQKQQRQQRLQKRNNRGVGGKGMDANRYYNPRHQHPGQFGRKRPRVSSFADQSNAADKRRQAAKHRKLQILKQQEQKRQAGYRLLHFVVFVVLCCFDGIFSLKFPLNPM